MTSGGNVKSTANGVDYPIPLTIHVVVVNDHTIFMETLQKFYHAIGTELFIPAIDGKPLDLHLLYVEVTKRGGYEKVLDMRKWTSVSAMFLFSPKTTSASYALKKHYFRLLYHYEKVYFFRVSDIVGSSTSTIKSPGNNENHVFNERNMLTGNDDGSLVTLECVVEAKLDNCNLISVEIDNEVYYTILLHPTPTIANYQSPPNTTTSVLPTNVARTFAASVASNNSTDNTNPSELRTKVTPTTPVGITNAELHTEARKTKGKRSRGDPDRPKRPRSSYTFFLMDKQAQVNSTHPKARFGITKRKGKLWKSMPTSEKRIYERKAMADRERYKKEKEEYEEQKRIKQENQENKKRV